MLFFSAEEAKGLNKVLWNVSLELNLVSHTF